MSRLTAILIVAAVLAASTGTFAQTWKFTLPEGTLAFNFGNLVIPELKNVMSKTTYSDEQGYGWVSTEGLSLGGGKWPDPLTGTYVGTLSSKEFQFRAKVPDGDYLVWLSAGKVIRPDLKERRFLLKLNDKVLFDETPTDEELAGEQYLFRFMRTQYSEKPDGLWKRYIDVMYPSTTLALKVTGGEVRLSAANHFLSTLILVPAAKKAEFDALVADVTRKRIDSFEKSCPRPEQTKPEKPEGAGDFILFVPEPGTQVWPWTAPTDDERKFKGLDAAGAPGQHVLMRLAVTPFADLGKCSLVLSDLKGPGTIGTAAVQGHYKNYRYGRKQVSEMALVPELTLDVESGLTQEFWLWMKVPDDARPGRYTATFAFKPEKAAPVPVPVTFEVYPFKLEPTLPVAYGFWGTGWTAPFLSDDVKRKVMRDRLEWLRETGFTSITLGGPWVKRLKPEDGTVELQIDPMLFELAKETGLAAHPHQPLLHAGIMASVGRRIGSLLPGGRGVYNNPGVELKQPEFRKYFLDACRQYRAFIDKMGLPVVVTSVDEPRERRINSWNRNFDDTVAYCDMMREAGLKVCVNPMRDTDHYVNKDYLPFIDHVDVLSTHAWEQSKKFMRQTLEKKKVLWLFNCGKDRYSWGFYNWRAGSNGRWEWHFCWPRNRAEGGYPGREWQNPFTGLHGLASAAPYTTRKGGILYQSAFLDIADGITDYAYIYTLEEALKKPYATQKAKTAGEAKAFLTALKRAMPEFPKVKGLGPGADGSAVGMGIEDEAKTHVDAWRRTIAGYLKELKK